MKSPDPFRPSRMPAQLLYNSLQAEALKRKSRGLDEWILAERKLMWSVARDYAQKMGLRVPTMAEVELRKRLATGHVDYCAKWAYGIAEFLTQERAHERSVSANHV